MPMKPEIPNPHAALEALQKMPTRISAVRDALEKASQHNDVWPEWRKVQVFNFLRAMHNYAQDLQETHRTKRVDSIAVAVRNLVELSMWIQYCGSSLEKAEDFYYDCVRDGRELFEAVQALHTSVDGIPEPRLRKVEEELRTIAMREGISDYEDKYTKVRDAAGEIGRLPVFAPIYKVCSKLAHPTSLALNMGADILLDALLSAGRTLCVRNLDELIAQILLAYPTISRNSSL